MTIKLDWSVTCTIVTCTVCPWWQAFAWTRSDGWATAARHEKDFHPGATAAQKNAHKHRSDTP